MADPFPHWARPLKSKGWLAQTVAEDAKSAEHAVDAKPGLLIGRNGQVCEIEIAHKSASRVHACIAFDETEQPFLVDLGSTHGTFVDGEALEKGGRRRLEPGKSVITIGRAEITIRLLRNHATRASTRDSGAAGREQHRRGDRHPQHHSGRGNGGRGRDLGRDAGSHGGRGHSWREWDGPDRGPALGREHRDDRFEGRSLPRSDYNRGREHVTSRQSEQRDRNGHPSSGRRIEQPAQQSTRHHGSSRPVTQEEAHRKRHSSDEEGRDPGERRQRQRKTGFEGPAAVRPAAAPTQTPAEIVRSVMGGGGPVAPMSLQQKKKLLWGKKPDPEEPAPSVAFGANRWDTAAFSNAGDKDKFIKLMGVKADLGSINLTSVNDRPHSPTTREALTKDKQDRLLHDVEQHFMTGLRRADGRTVGLGL